MSASQMKFRQKQDGRIRGVEKREEDGDCRTSRKREQRRQKLKQRKDLIRETV